MKLTFVQTHAIRNILIAILESGQAKITFLKADNTIRGMNATRSESFVGTAFEEPKHEVKGSLVVYDVDEADYRSFRLESLIEINGVPLTTLVKLVG